MKRERRVPKFAAEIERRESGAGFGVMMNPYESPAPIAPSTKAISRLVLVVVCVVLFLTSQSLYAAWPGRGGLFLPIALVMISILAFWQCRSSGRRAYFWIPILWLFVFAGMVFITIVTSLVITLVNASLPMEPGLRLNNAASCFAMYVCSAIVLWLSGRPTISAPTQESN